jgi:hypothetical protein
MAGGRSAVLGIGLLLTALASGAQAMTDAQVREQIIRESIASHGGYCVCPWQKDHKGKRCGIRSLYNKGGGYPPQCYAHDVDDTGVEAWLNEHIHPSR